MFVLKRRIYHTACRKADDVALLSPKCVKQLYSQCANDYIALGVLDNMLRLEDVYKMAAYIVYFRFRGKIFKSKGGDMTKEMLSSHFEKAIPASIRGECNLEQWFTYIHTFYKNENMNNLDAEETMRGFLAIYSKYDIAMSSYFWPQKGDAITAMRFPAKSFCAVNVNGVYFLPETGRKDVVLQLKYEDIISVAGYKKDFRIVLKDPSLEQKVLDVRFKVRRAREMAEEIVTYGQIHLAERRYCAWVKPLELKRPGQRQRETSDNATSDARSDISRHKGLRSVFGMPAESAQLDDDKKDTAVITASELEKLHKIGLRHYELKKPFLMYEQAFPLSVANSVVPLDNPKPEKSLPEESKVPGVQQSGSPEEPPQMFAELKAEVDNIPEAPKLALPAESKAKEEMASGANPSPEENKVDEQPHTDEEAQNASYFKSNASLIAKADLSVSKTSGDEDSIEDLML